MSVCINPNGVGERGGEVKERERERKRARESERIVSVPFIACSKQFTSIQLIFN